VKLAAIFPLSIPGRVCDEVCIDLSLEVLPKGSAGQSEEEG
jgi:hypothetical protein